MHERAQTLARRRVPHADQPIARTADDEGAIADEIHAADGIRMRGQPAHHPRRSHVPEEDGLVVASADEHVALGREGDGVDVVVVAEQREREGFAGLDVPEADGFVVGAGGEGEVVGGPGEGGDAGEVRAREGVQRGAVREGPDSDGGVSGCGGLGLSMY